MLAQFNTLVKRNLGFQLRDFQLEAIGLGYKHPKGVYQIATGGGKSIIIAGLAFKDSSLVVVDSIDLMRQTANGLKKVFTEEEIGEVGAGICKWERITVGITKSLINRPDMLRNFEHCLWDECHTGIGFDRKTLQPRATLLNLMNPPKLHGFTGTFVRRLKDEEAGLRQMFGEILMTVDTTELILSDAVPRTKVMMVLCSSKELMDDYASMIVESRKGQKGLILTRRVEHCKQLAKRFSATPCHGSVPKKERKAAIDDLVNGLSNVIVATKVFEKGVNIPEIDYAINLKQEFGEVGCRQSLGRILRGSNQKTYFDFFDHSLAAYNRLRLYKSEYGLETTIVPVTEAIGEH